MADDRPGDPAATDGDGIAARFRGVQDAITAFLSDQGAQACREDRCDYTAGSGGGVTRIWEDGELWEKAGVAFSAIRGRGLPALAATAFSIPPEADFLATGVSLVIHPRNPHVPTVHLNVRYFEAGEAWWFGGGMDLTPVYPRPAGVIAFHRALRDLCARHGEDYAAHKRRCDEYFRLRHRDEARGVGGIFFDHLRADRGRHLAFALDLGGSFPDLYRPFLAARRDPYGERERAFQLLRRSRYVEFNLLYDRGTLFGLQSGGRTESILLSMPPLARWAYDWRPDPGGPEAEAEDIFRHPRDWAGMAPPG